MCGPEHHLQHCKLRGPYIPFADVVAFTTALVNGDDNLEEPTRNSENSPVISSASFIPAEQDHHPASGVGGVRSSILAAAEEEPERAWIHSKESIVVMR